MYETVLDECTGSYEALSYVWGDGSEKTPIQINGSTLEVGTNLRLALFNLREPNKPRTLWIDAICINQDDISERNQQVTIMGDIYSRARRTVVWLCDEIGSQTKKAIPMLQDLAEHAIQALRVTGEDEVIHANNQPVSLIEKDGVTDPMVDRYKGDATAPPFTRESMVAPSLDSPGDSSCTKGNYCGWALLHRLGSPPHRG